MNPAVGQKLDEQRVEQFISAPGPETFAPVFEAFYGRLIRYFLLHRMNRAVAEDLSQDVLMAVYRGVAALRSRQLFRAWLFRIARNAMLRHLKTAVETVPLDEAQAQTVDAAPCWPGEVHDWLVELSGNDREILNLRYVEELSYQEIADVLDLPMGTVKWRLFHAKKCLADVMESSARERVV